jgi:thioredoxin 2
MLIKCPHCQKFNRIPVERLSESPICGSCKSSLLVSPIDADEASFHEILKSCTLPIIVDFWAPWCGPCKIFAPTFKLSAAKFGEKILYVKIDTEANSSIAQQYNIRSIPTLAVFKNATEIERISGALPPAQLAELIARFI